MKYVTFISRLEKRLHKMADDELLRFGNEICKRLFQVMPHTQSSINGEMQTFCWTPSVHVIDLFPES